MATPSMLLRRSVCVCECCGVCARAGVASAGVDVQMPHVKRNERSTGGGSVHAMDCTGHGILHVLADMGPFVGL